MGPVFSVSMIHSLSPSLPHGLGGPAISKLFKTKKPNPIETEKQTKLNPKSFSSVQPSKQVSCGASWFLHTFSVGETGFMSAASQAIKTKRNGQVCRRNGTVFLTPASKALKDTFAKALTIEITVKNSAKPPVEHHKEKSKPRKIP